MALRSEYRNYRSEEGKEITKPRDSKTTMQWYRNSDDVTPVHRDVTCHTNTDTMVKKMLMNSSKRFGSLAAQQDENEMKMKKHHDKLERIMDRLSLSSSSSSSSSSDIDDIVDSSDDMMRLLRRDVRNLTSSMQSQTSELDKLSTDVNSLQRILAIQKKSAKILDMQQNAMEQMNWVLGADTELDSSLHRTN